MDDLISRRAAIDALNEYFARIGQLKRRGLNKGEKAISLDTVETIKTLPSAQPEHLVKESGNLVKGLVNDCISRKAAIAVADSSDYVGLSVEDCKKVTDEVVKGLKQLPPVQPETEKYEYHYDHTDCIWYRPEARNRCPVTCAQYRDGWNDAMNYIFHDGKGYRPYRRDKKYEERREE